MRKLDNLEIEKTAPVLMESTGPYHWLAAKLLTKQTRNVLVVNPILSNRMIKQSVRKRKTDRVDAAHLAFMAGEGYGYPFQETESMAQGKALVRHYWKLKLITTNLKRHESYLKNYRHLRLPSPAAMLKKQIDNLEQTIIKRYSPGNDLKYLDSIPGVSPILGATILAELGLLSKFKTIKQIIAYAGLDPAVKQTGSKKVSYCKLSKRGSPTLRMALYFAAFGCFFRQPFNRFYRSYKERGLHHNAALCILSRKILRIAVSLLKKREIFKEQYISLDRT